MSPTDQHATKGDLDRLKADVEKRFDRQDERIDRLPTVKHVQFLVLSAVVASQIIPGLDVARAAAPAFHSTLRATGLVP